MVVKFILATGQRSRLWGAQSPGCLPTRAGQHEPVRLVVRGQGCTIQACFLALFVCSVKKPQCQLGQRPSPDSGPCFEPRNHRSGLPASDGVYDWAQSAVCAYGHTEITCSFALLFGRAPNHLHQLAPYRVRSEWSAREHTPWSDCSRVRHVYDRHKLSWCTSLSLCTPQHVVRDRLGPAPWFSGSIQLQGVRIYLIEHHAKLTMTAAVDIFLLLFFVVSARSGCCSCAVPPTCRTSGPFLLLRVYAWFLCFQTADRGCMSTCFDCRDDLRSVWRLLRQHPTQLVRNLLVQVRQRPEEWPCVSLGAVQRLFFSVNGISSSRHEFVLSETRHR